MCSLNMNKLDYPCLIYNERRDVAEMIYGDILITVFINGDTQELDVTADTIDEDGWFQQNIEWTTCSRVENGNVIIDDDSYDFALKTIRKYVKNEFRKRNNE